MFSHQLPKCCIFGMLKHDHCKASQFNVIFLGNQINGPLIGSCGNVYRIDSYEHGNECKKGYLLFGVKNESLME